MRRSLAALALATLPCTALAWQAPSAAPPPQGGASLQQQVDRLQGQVDRLERELQEVRRRLGAQASRARAPAGGQEAAAQGSGGSGPAEAGGPQQPGAPQAQGRPPPEAPPRARPAPEAQPPPPRQQQATAEGEREEGVAVASVILTGRVREVQPDAVVVQAPDGSLYPLRVTGETRITRRGRRISARRIPRGATVQAEYDLIASDSVATELEVLRVPRR